MFKKIINLMRFETKFNLHDIAGPSISMPRAIFCVTSSELDPLSASFASIPAFDKSINNKKKNSASLCNTKRKKRASVMQLPQIIKEIR